jgi:hypothetical protein
MAHYDNLQRKLDFQFSRFHVNSMHQCKYESQLDWKCQFGTSVVTYFVTINQVAIFDGKYILFLYKTIQTNII